MKKIRIIITVAIAILAVALGLTYCIHHEPEPQPDPITDPVTYHQIFNHSDSAVTVWVTLGATPGCLQDVTKIPFVTS